MACAPAITLIAAASGGALLAQSGSPTLPATTEAVPATTGDALRAMARQAAVLFAGQVVAVRRRDGVNGATGVVEIEFAVDEAVRGASGGTYVLREWAGLCPAGDQPFRVGQRYLMLLHAPSAVGLSSPVGGMDGAIPIRGGPAPAEPGWGTRAAADARTVDLRWIATKVVREISYRPESPVQSTARPSSVHAEVMAAAPAQGPAPDSGAQAANFAGPGAADTALAPEAQSAGYATVLALLRSWEKDDDAAR
jgi:hypothetical protein